MCLRKVLTVITAIETVSGIYFRFVQDWEEKKRRKAEKAKRKREEKAFVEDILAMMSKACSATNRF